MKKKKYDIFISYRRSDVKDKAEHLHDLLNAYYKQRISFDRENLTGLFNVALIDRIDTVKDFILLIGKHSFSYSEKDFSPETVAFYNKLARCDRQEFADTINELGPNAPIDYVRIEIGRALHRVGHLNIIPIVPQQIGKSFLADLNLPPDIAGIKFHNAVSYSESNDARFKDVIPDVRRSLQSTPDKPILKIIGVIAALIIVVAGIVGISFGRNWMNDKKAFEECRTYGDYYKYQQDGHRFFNNESNAIVKEFERLERGGFAYVNNTSGADKRDSIEVTWSDNISLQQLKALVGVLDSMMYIPAGTFTMGTNEPLDNEGPAHQVTISKDFYMSKFELTRDVWFYVMNDSVVAGNDARLPMTNISWNDCKQFIDKLNELTGLEFALPSEAQWEYAATGGGRHKKYPGDGTLNEVAWHGGNSMNRLHTTAESKQPNAFELYDMLGNAEEWCNDYAYADYSASPAIDPKGLPSGEKCIVRGGSFKTEPMDITITYRDAANANAISPTRGLRLILLF